MNISTVDIDRLTTLKAGDEIKLSGVVYTARDAAHKKICAMIKNGDALPFSLLNCAIYYAGPTPTKEGMIIGSCGPTTSSRMDMFTPTLLDRGLKIMIGKGPRSDDVIKSMIKNRAVYLCALGGAGALCAKAVKSCEVIAFPELGCESIKKLEIENFELFVGIDCYGNSIFK